jgi:hypothetical protein
VLPKSIGEQQTTYTYIPLDPLPVAVTDGDSCAIAGSSYKQLIDSFPDQAVRIAVAQLDQSGSLAFGPAKVGASGHSYQVVLDYISVDATRAPVYVERFTNGEPKVVSVFDATVPVPTRYRLVRDPSSDAYAARQSDDVKEPPGERVIFPVYVGIGLRLTASLTVLKATANLSSLAGIAADAAAGKVTGSLVVQTLGISGRSVSAALPLPSELNETTIGNAILAIGSIKALLYDASTEISPRVVGVYNPIGGGQQVVNGLISVLTSERILWHRPCRVGKPSAVPAG